MIRRAALLLGGIVLLSSCALPGNVTGSRQVTAVFDDAGDLVAGHSVQIADVRIGSITSVELTDDFRALVTMSLEDGVFIPRESQALLRTTSLLGEKFVELRPLNPDAPTEGEDLRDGDVIEITAQAPELEFVAERAVEILGAVVASDIASLVETGSIGFGGRGGELRSIVGDLSTVSGTLAAQTDEIVRIITALDGASATLAAGSSQIGALLSNLAATAETLSRNRVETIDAIRELTRLARIQNDRVFEPHLARLDAQVRQLHAILAEVDRNQEQVGTLVFWLGQFATDVPLAVPEDFAQVYTMIVTADGS